MFTFYLLYGIQNKKAYLVDDAVQTRYTRFSSMLRLVTFTKKESAFSSYTIRKKHTRLEEAVIHRSEKNERDK
ncbi:hypothetical protein AU387_16400 [Bacillus halotolerans]|nr:hypothetical protein AU387_16400 [Bacillus halotolerans]